MKKRDASKGLAVLVCDKEFAQTLAEFSDAALVLAGAFWPGQLTMLLPLKNETVSKLVVQNGKVALRLPASEVARAVAYEFGGAVVGTSANISGGDPLPTSAAIADAFPELKLAIKSGERPSGVSSTIFDVEKRRVTREGALKESEIKAALEGV